LLERYDRDVKALKKDIFTICWYMRGMSPNDGMMLGIQDRTIIVEIIKDNMKATKESGMPFI